jgi:hypothetical protein
MVLSPLAFSGRIGDRRSTNLTAGRDWPVARISAEPKPAVNWRS